MPTLSERIETATTTMESAAALANLDSSKLHQIVHGDTATVVATEGGNIDSVAKTIANMSTLNLRGAWATATAYVVKDMVVEGTSIYVCAIAHTSAVFATDAAAGKWAVYQGATREDLASTATGKGAALIGTDAADADSTGLWSTVQGFLSQVFNLFTRNVDTIAALRAITPTALKRRIYVRAYAKEGDEGHGTFREVTGAAPGTYVDNGGTIIVPTGGDGSKAWLRVIDGFVTVKHFGAKGDFNGVSGTDDYSSLKAAIDWCTANHVKLLVPFAHYYSSQPLLISSWNGSAYSGYVSCNVEGEVTPFMSSTLSPTITFPSSAPFGVGIQNGRSVKIANVLIKGGNDYSANIVDPNKTELLNNATYVINSCRDSRYSPYTGICIDPFGTSVPSDGGFPGMSSYYATGAAGSSDIEINHVHVRGFVVGACITPNQVTQNAEDITFRKCSLLYNKVGVAIGQSQSRRISFMDSDVLGALYAFDGISYGRQQGFSPLIVGGNIGWVKYIFNVQQSFGMPIKAMDIHAETFASIGFIGVGTSTSSFPSKISNSLFNVYCFDGRTADVFLRTHADIVFDACEFNIGVVPGVDKFPVLRIQAMSPERGAVQFRGCEFRASADTETELNIAPSSYTKLAFGGGVRFDNCTVAEGSAKNSGNSRLSDNLYAHTYTYTSKSYTPPYGVFFDGATNGTAGRQYLINNRSLHSASLGSLTVTVGSNGQATFTVADPTIVRLGDLIYTTTAIAIETGAPAGVSATATNYLCLGMVSNIVGSDITISGIPQSLTTGAYTLETRWWTRLHKPSVGDISSGTNTILNVTNVDTWAVGHKIMGSGIPIGSYITNIAGTTITMSANATATTVGVRLYDSDVYSVTGAAV